jgi:hypothetical protein
MAKQKIETRPQPGFQFNFLRTPADIAIGGGAAGVGKTFIELMEVLRHRKNPNFGAIIFRRSYPEIMMQGGLWDEANNMYPYCGAIPNKSDVQWNFLSGAKTTFRHMQSEKVLDEYQGAQIPLIQFDEMTHFTKRMFIYMLSRNRQGSCQGIKPYMRGTCNPDPDSWLAEFLEWWIDQESGFPIPERAGVIRYMVADQDQFVWGTTKNEVFEKAPHVFNSDAVLKTGIPREQLVKSVTFIPGSIYENKELLKKDPGYIANLLAQDEATQARLLHGNWKIRTDKMNLFDFLRLNDMFFNLIPPDPYDEYYISIDHAREGRDFCVIGTWHGWRCIRVDILPKSDTKDILRVVEMIRRTYGGIPTSNIIIDQDGIGVKDFLECHSFFGGSSENEVINELPSFKRIGDKFQKRGYRNKRGQLYYFLAEKVNAADIFIDLENVWFHFDQLRVERVHAIKIGSKEFLVKDLFKEDLRTVRKRKTVTEKIKEIISKEEHKIALGGRSPDFGDMLMMRGQFEFIKKKKYMKQ